LDRQGKESVSEDFTGGMGQALALLACNIEERWRSA
jgi:hypothetical protein